YTSLVGKIENLYYLFFCHRTLLKTTFLPHLHYVLTHTYNISWLMVKPRAIKAFQNLKTMFFA
ncbi:hypothetical protein, partial [uncultured Helicobacter sp.]|uniref:hypothetical protein n=1 Tax=uncultured Helicobacter sp. TaxID=175537 RepID=UPI00261CA36F